MVHGFGRSGFDFDSLVVFPTLRSFHSVQGIFFVGLAAPTHLSHA